jgi:hypothetical protein
MAKFWGFEVKTFKNAGAVRGRRVRAATFIAQA